MIPLPEVLGELLGAVARALRRLGDHRRLDVVELGKEIDRPGRGLALAAENDAGGDQIADFLGRRGDLVHLVGAHHQGLGDDEAAFDGPRAIRLRQQVVDLQALHLDGGAGNAVRREESQHRIGVRTDLLLRLGELVRCRDEAHRPQRQIRLHLALRHALYGDEPVAGAGGDKAAADEPAAESDTEGENGGGEEGHERGSHGQFLPSRLCLLGHAREPDIVGGPEAAIRAPPGSPRACGGSCSPRHTAGESPGAPHTTAPARGRSPPPPGSRTATALPAGADHQADDRAPRPSTTLIARDSADRSWTVCLTQASLPPPACLPACRTGGCGAGGAGRNTGARGRRCGLVSAAADAGGVPRAGQGRGGASARRGE